jgi:hypothetical protein
VPDAHRQYVIQALVADPVDVDMIHDVLEDIRNDTRVRNRGRRQAAAAAVVPQQVPVVIVPAPAAPALAVPAVVVPAPAAPATPGLGGVLSAVISSPVRAVGWLASRINFG